MRVFCSPRNKNAPPSISRNRQYENCAEEPELLSLPKTTAAPGPDWLVNVQAWNDGEPALIRPNLACLDYSAVNGGRLVAYRLGDEQRLLPENFVWVENRP